MMSRSPHLPPRGPPLSPQIVRTDNSLFTQSCRFPSESSPFGEQPSWLDDLLAEPGRSLNAAPLRRACSDSDAILDVLTTLQSPVFPIEEGDSLLNGEAEGSPVDVGASENGCGLQDGCVYGPNSPRQKSRLTSSESSMVNAVLENVPSNPLQYLVVNTVNALNGNEPNGMGDASSAVGYADQEKASRRRSGQRSRVRKLQYIAELERTVETLQNMGADLAVRVASLFQLRAALSMENKQLRRQITSLQQEKLIKDGQMQTLKKEAERLKFMPGRHRRSRSVASCFETNPFQADSLAINWQMLDMDKLSLNGGPAPPRHGFGP